MNLGDALKRAQSASKVLERSKPTSVRFSWNSLQSKSMQESSSRSSRKSSSLAQWTRSGSSCSCSIKRQIAGLPVTTPLRDLRTYKVNVVDSQAIQVTVTPRITLPLVSVKWSDAASTTYLTLKEANDSSVPLRCRKLYADGSPHRSPRPLPQRVGLDMEQAKADVRPFLHDARQLDGWSRELFLEIANRIRVE